MESKCAPMTKIKPNERVKPPHAYEVIYHDDDKTTFDFVIYTLIQHFGYTNEDAVNMANTIHENGKYAVAVLPHELAEQKVHDVTIESRNSGFPLVLEIKPNI
jgi:ATP-dependent Clp protease adapter protein ClpS